MIEVRNIYPLLRAGLRLIDLLVQHPEQSSATEEISQRNPPALGKSFPKGAYADAPGQDVLGFQRFSSGSSASPLASGLPHRVELWDSGNSGQ